MHSENGLLVNSCDPSSVWQFVQACEKQETRCLASNVETRSSYPACATTPNHSLIISGSFEFRISNNRTRVKGPYNTSKSLPVWIKRLDVGDKLRAHDVL
ncbi:hypothetical protein H9L39_01922 [Fusarium oxysporum f. sp. albedinis]|nr:hypothetical protein H9L39_01922 [Fusarium oxysporum f. sp. albedinis]